MASTAELDQAAATAQLAANEYLLAAASRGDLSTIKTLLNPDPTAAAASSSSSSHTVVAAQPWYESPTCLSWSALHYASENGHSHVVRYLLANGAIWNAVDENGYTAGDVAWSGNWTECYRVLLEEGVRQGLLLGLLGRKEGEEEGEGMSEDDEEQEGEGEGGVATSSSSSTAQLNPTTNQLLISAPKDAEVVNDNEAFLKSPLRFVTDPSDGGRGARCMDQDDNMVMAGWETEIMKRSAEALCKGLDKRRVVKDEDGEERVEGFKVLNIGYGLGIIDDFLQTHSPATHVIIEPHPDVIRYLRTRPIASAPGVVIIEKTWEAALEDPSFWEVAPEGFDAIYADPFAQDYKDLKVFFDRLPDLLRGGEPGGEAGEDKQARFGFFHGLAATNRFLYDVYTRLVELDLRDIGLETQWETVPVDMEDAEEVWQGVRRRYWTLDEYRLPTCRMGVL